jgi:hypothetical protein
MGTKNGNIYSTSETRGSFSKSHLIAFLYSTPLESQPMATVQVLSAAILTLKLETLKMETLKMNR